MIDSAGGMLLTSRGVDPARLVTRYRKYETADVIMVGAPTLPVRVVSIRQIDVAVRDGHEAPVLECRLRIGQSRDVATLFGNVLTLANRLPATLSLAASGRQLGNIVATSVPLLDERRITHVDAVEGRTRFVLESDLITIGEARRAAGYR